MKLSSLTLITCIVILQFEPMKQQLQEIVTCTCPENGSSPGCKKIVNIMKDREIECYSRFRTNDGKDINATCLNNIENQYLGQKQSIYRFSLIECITPNDSLKNIMKKLGILKAETLKVRFFNENHIDLSLFSGLEYITNLDLSANNLSINVKDIFTAMPNLKELNLVANNVKLTKGTFYSAQKLEVLDLGNNGIKYLHPGVFQNFINLHTLTLWINQIKNLQREVFCDIPNLRLLDISENEIQTLTKDVFADLTNLTDVNFQGNKLVEIPEGIFSNNKKLKVVLMKNMKTLKNIPVKLLANLPDLSEINLSNCGISLLPEDFLWGSPYIHKIILNGNSLTEIPENLFRDAINLIYINLNTNNITYLPNRIFLRTANLQWLHLGNNQLTEIQRDLFSTLTSLKILNLSFNKIRFISSGAFDYVRELEELNLSNNFLVTPLIGLNAVTELKILDLSNNLLSSIGEDWHELDSIQQINLMRNNFSSLQVESLLPLCHTAQLEIDISFNNIRTVDFNNIHDGLYAQWQGTSVVVKLDGNLLNCDCKSYSLAKYFQKKQFINLRRNLIEFSSNDLLCATPEHLKNKLITDVPPSELKCKIKSEGNFKFTECEFFKIPEGSYLEVNCINKGLLEIPNFFEEIKLHEISYRNIKLNLTGNNINTISKLSQREFENVTHLDLSYNNISHIKILQLPPSIKVLKLHNNHISYLDPKSIDFMRNSSALQEITLHNNPWKCDCEAVNLLIFIQTQYGKIDMLHNITCINGNSLSLLTVNDICPFSKKAVIISSAVLAVLGITFGIVYSLYYRYNQEIKVWLYAHQLCLWFVTEEELDRDKTYDAFISYSHQDEEFVKEHIVPVLENGVPNFTLCLHYRDWVVGDYIPTQIARSVENSRRTIVILSPNFLESVWGKMEFRTAHSQALSEGRARVIVVLYGDIGPTDDLEPELKAYISMNTYIKWGDPRFWDRLKFALPHPPRELNGIPLFESNLASQQNKSLLTDLNN